MQGPYFLDQSIVVATILNTKRKHDFLECYVTLKECEAIKSLLTNLFANYGVEVYISENIDSDFFEIMNGIVITNLKNDIDINTKYKKSDLPVEIMNVVWDDSLIYNYLSDIRYCHKSVNFKPSKLDEIVDCILESPNSFYESVACHLSKEEYEYLKRKIEIKNCKNCTTNNCLNHNLPYSCCEKWLNDELIGRAKVKCLI